MYFIYKRLFYIVSSIKFCYTYSSYCIDLFNYNSVHELLTVHKFRNQFFFNINKNIDNYYLFRKDFNFIHFIVYLLWTLEISVYNFVSMKVRHPCSNLF